MATTTDTIKNTYPLPAYNYRVEIAGTAVAFSEVSGLDLSFGHTIYKESQIEAGLTSPRVFYMPAQVKPVFISMKKGVVRGGVSINPLYNWINQTVINQIEKKDIFVRLMDEAGSPVISWQVINAFPVALIAPKFSANSNEVAIEQLNLMADRIAIEEA